MFTALIRVVKYGLQNFTRNLWLSGATLAIMVLTLLMAEGLFLFNAAARATLVAVQNKIDVSLYVKQEASEDAILTMKSDLERLPEVKSVEYISREKALDLFKERRGGDPSITQALEELGENPLLASLNIRAADPKEYPKIIAYADENFKESIEKVSYVETELLIARLVRLTDTVKTFGVAFNIFLAFIAVVVTFNTISLRGPYFITGMLYGIIGAIASIVIALPFIYASAPSLLAVLPEFNLQTYFYTNFFTLFFYLVVVGVILGVISSMIAISRYLKV